MSDLAVNVTWQEILRETQSGDIPHCRAIACKSQYHHEIIEALAGLILGSYSPSHPDLIIIGTTDKAPDISSCRSLISDIALKPLESSRRLGVILCADRLLLPAANSLLKLAEEPPAYACLLFLMEDGRLFLPTLRSRSRFNTLTSDDRTEARKFPQSISEWSSWLGVSRKGSDVEGIVSDLKSWTGWALDERDYNMAAKLERLRLIAERKNLSGPMLCDLITLTLREESKNLESILDDFR